MVKTGGGLTGLPGTRLSLRLSQVPGDGESLTRGLPPTAVEGSSPSPPPIPPTVCVCGGGGLSVSGPAWVSVGSIPWYGDDRRLPCGRQGLFSSAGLATANLGPVCLGGGSTGLFTPFCESSSFIKDPCRYTFATVVLEERRCGKK